MPATSSRWPASRTRAPATRCAIRSKPVILEKMEFPEPVIEIAIEPKSKADQEKLGVALAKLAAEDPSFRVLDRSGVAARPSSRAWANCISTSRSTSCKRTYKVEANIGAPQVAYREKITRTVTESTTRTRSRPAAPASSRASRSSSSRTSAGKRLRVRERRSSAARCRRNTSRASRRASSRVLGAGVLAGFPVVDLKVPLIDGAYHDVDSSALAFEIASRAALPRGAAEGRAGAARADHEGRGGDAGGLYRLGHRRPQLAARPDPGPGHARQRERHQRDGAARPTCSVTSTTCVR